MSTDTAAAIDSRSVAFFDAFGFLKLEGFFAEEFADINATFDALFEEHREEIFVNHSALHDDEERLILMNFIDRSPKLAWLKDDPRVLEIMSALFRRPFEFADSDASIFSCETGWHADTFGAPMGQLHIKMSMYLDPLHADNGAIRVIPGTHLHKESFAKLVRGQLREGVPVEDVFGISGQEIPSWVLPSSPGDLIIWNYRTVHASYNGHVGRRLMSISFRELQET